MADLTALNSLYPRQGRTQLPSASSTTTSAAKPKWNGSAWLALSREEMQLITTAQEDEQYRLMWPNLVCPSYRYHGRDASCARCRDIGYISVLLDPSNDRGGSKLVPCECSAQIIGDRAASAIVGEEVGRVMRFSAFRTNWPDQGHNRIAAEALAAAQAWAEQTGPRWLVLYGNPGSGKTFLAVAALRRMVERGVQARYWQAGELLMLLRAGMRDGPAAGVADDARDKMMTCEAVVLDDYGIERHTEWADSEMETFLTLRYQRHLWTCITANSMGHLSERLQSRVTDLGSCALVDMSGARDVRAWR